MVGSVAVALDVAYHENVCNTDVDDSYRHRYNYGEDIDAFCTEYRQDKLFHNIPARQHKAFSSFLCEMTIK